MAAGDKWTLPDGRQAIELDGSTDGELRVAPIVGNWPFPSAPELVPRAGAKKAPMRYYRQSSYPEGLGEALL